MKTLVSLSLILILVLSACVKSEITTDKAIQIATKEAERNHYQTKNADVEVLKVKKGRERGPLRILSIARYFPGERLKILLDNEYWIVFFYPKGNLDNPTILDGEFTVLVELHSGKILESFPKY